MDATVRQDAVDDLLEYCRNEQRVLNMGRQLAPVLLGRAWNSAGDDYALATAITDLIGAEVTHWRQKLGVAQHAGDDTQELQARIKADLAVGHPHLERLSLLWAYYIDHLSTAHIAGLHGSVPRTIQHKIKAGRADVAGLVARQERTMGSPQVAQVQHQPESNGHQPFIPDTSVPVSSPVAARQAAPSHMEADHRRSQPPVQVRHRTKNAIEQRISGDHVQAVIGPVAGPVNQSQHIHHHAPASEPKEVNDASASLFWVCLGLLAVAGYWLIHTLPWISVGVLVLITGWRTLRHGWHSTHRWAAQLSDGERWWYVGYTGAWLSTLAWSLFLLNTLSRSLAMPEVSMERLSLLAVFLGVSLIVFWLSTVDVLRWISTTAPAWWPARRLLGHADWSWQQRWPLLGITWLMLLVFSGSLLFFKLGGQ